MGHVLVRYWAAARAAAGVDEERVEAPDVASLLAEIRGAHGPQLAAVLSRSSLLIDGSALGARDPSSVVLTDSSVVEVLPPFAGGCA
ncbi:MAG TPA: MoaD/ThiS family protein [Actinomycetes bacterium]|nr:MoaD/ThiS family protein [Actinomycetes bacterium]